MAEESERDRLSREEAAGWAEVTDLLDRVPPSQAEAPGVGPEDWTVKDVLFHLGSWTDEAAVQLAAIREGRYRDPSVDTDARNAEYVAAGRELDLDAVRRSLERARARALAQWAATTELTAPAVEWFGESGPEHYREHVGDLRRFVERLAVEGRPGAAARRAAMLAAERETWDEINGVVGSVPPHALDTPGLTPDGWSVKDTMWHVAKWWEDFLDAVPRFGEAGFDPDDESADAVDATNRAWFEESRGLALDAVRDRWTSAREAGVRAFGDMAEPPATAERWFGECGTIHYEKHLIDLRPWVAKGSGFGLRDRGPQ